MVLKTGETMGTTSSSFGGSGSEEKVHARGDFYFENVTTLKDIDYIDVGGNKVYVKIYEGKFLTKQGTRYILSM